MNAFQNRAEAGRELAEQLRHYAGRSDVLVLGLPRGGVPVAFEVAMVLDAPLDVFLVRKLGVPWQPELAMGAIASGGVTILNERVVETLGISESDIGEVAANEQAELNRRESAYRNGRPGPHLEDRIAILVDDGLATGSSMRAAVAAVRRKGAREVVVAVPVAAIATCEEFRANTDVDDVVCAKTPEPFYAVGNWYEDFSQITDEEVCELLEAANARRAVAGR